MLDLLAAKVRPCLLRTAVDAKAKKRLELVNKKLQALRLQLAGARKQNDEPGEVQGLEKEIAALEAEATKLKSGK